MKVPGGGPGPRDRELFAPSQLPALRAAVRDLTYLRQRGYALPGALKLVGDRHALRERQRVAIRRATSEAEGAAARAPRRVPSGASAPGALHLDGFNVVITCETALRGGVLVRTLDGGVRDLAGVHGSYRPSEVTDRALALLAAQLDRREWSRVPTTWWLDAPVSNTGRLAARIREAAGARPWQVEVVPDPDAVLKEVPKDEVVVSADAVVLDGCGAWVDLAAEVVANLPEAWVVELVD